MGATRASARPRRFTVGEPELAQHGILAERLDDREQTARAELVALEVEHLD